MDKKTYPSVVVLFFAGFNALNFLFDALQIYTFGQSTAQRTLLSLSIYQPNPVLVFFSSLLMVVLMLLMFGAGKLALEKIYPNLFPQKAESTKTYSSPTSSSSIRERKNDLELVEFLALSNETDINQLALRVIKYTIISGSLTLLGGLVYILWQVRYLTPYEADFFWDLVWQMIILGSLAGVWVSSLELIVGKIAFFLAHIANALSIGIFLGLRVLPGNIFLPWLLVSIIVIAMLYTYIIFFMPSSYIDPGCFFSQKKFTQTLGGDIIRRGIFVPITSWIFTASLAWFIEKGSETEYGFVLLIVLGYFLLFFIIAFLQHVINHINL